MYRVGLLCAVLSILDGYLPADLFGGLPFYLTLTCIYLMLGVIWMVICLWDR